MPTCQKQDQLCRCIDWHDEDFDVEIDHFIQNFEFLRVELEYASLDTREPVRVCRIGRCRSRVPAVWVFSSGRNGQLSGVVSDAVSQGGSGLCKAMALRAGRPKTH